MRTTLDIDEPVLAALKEIQKRQGKSLGRVASDLLLKALNELRDQEGSTTEPFRWIAKPMGARVDVADREALYDLLDVEDGQ